MSAIATNVYPDIYPGVNVAAIDVVRDAAGPGRRLAVWLQGCLKRCRGCANAPFQPLRTSRIVDVSELVRLLADAGGLDGISLSGGEPVLQAKALMPWLRAVRQANLSVLCYTGYTLEELNEAAETDAALKSFMALIDVLIDGDYREALPRAGRYRPTSNQRLHYLSGRIAPGRDRHVSETVCRISGDAAVTVGTMPSTVMAEMARRLRARGIRLGEPTGQGGANLPP